MDYAEQAKRLLATTLQLKSSDVGPYTGQKGQHFLFLMRSRYIDHIREGRPLYCSQKQYAFLEDLMRQVEAKVLATDRLKNVAHSTPTPEP